MDTVPLGSVSISTMGVPTGTVSPGETSTRVTTPAHGDGSSTSDFAVSISTSTWLTATASPGITRHSTISASVRPSPASGSGNCCSTGIAQNSIARSTASSTRSRFGR